MQKTAYEMRISDWSSDVCSSDLIPNRTVPSEILRDESQAIAAVIFKRLRESTQAADVLRGLSESAGRILQSTASALTESGAPISNPNIATAESLGGMLRMSGFQAQGLNRSEEHTSELQSPMRISY